MHLVSECEDLRFVSSTLCNALLLRHLVVLGHLVLVVRMHAVLDDALRSLSGGQSSQIGQSLLGDDHVQIVLGVVDVGSHGHDAADAGGVRLALSGGGRVHDRQIGVAQEVSRASQTVDHLGASDERGVGVRVHVHLHGRVHGDHSQTSHALGEVRHRLGTDHTAVLVEVQVTVEALEALGRERQRDGGGVVQLPCVEEVQHRVLQHFRPHYKITPDF